MLLSASAIAVSGVRRETGVGLGQPWGQVGANAISKSQSAFRSKIMSLGKKSQFRSNPGLGPAKSLRVNSLEARAAGGPPPGPLRDAAPGKLRPCELNGTQAVGRITVVMLT